MDAQTSSPTRARWPVLVLLMGFTFQGHFHRISMSIAGNEELLGDGKLSRDQLGLIYSAFLLVYTVMMLPGGWLIDGWGPRRALTAMGWGLGLCTLLTGGLGWCGWSLPSLFVPLLLVRGLAGASSAPLHPGTSRAAALWLPPTARLTANGLLTCGALLGIAFVAPVFGSWMDATGWPSAFVQLGLLLMVYTLVWSIVTRKLPNSTSQQGDSTRLTLADFQAIVRHRALWLLMLSYGALGYFQYLFFYWIGQYFRDRLQFDDDHSRQATMFVNLSMACGMGVGGWCTARLCDAFGYRRGCRAMAVVGMTLSGVFAIWGACESRSDIAVWAFALAMGSLGLCESTFWTTASMLEPIRGGLAAAFLNTGANLVGTLSPTLTPWIERNFSWTMSIIAASVLCSLGGWLWLAFDPEGDHDRRAPSS